MGDDDGRKLFTGRLPNDITDDEVKYVFKTYGKVLDVRVHDREGAGGLRSAFVLYDTRHAAEAAIKVLHDVYRFREDSKDPISVSYPKTKAEYDVVRPRDDRGSDRRGSDRGHDRAPDRGGYDRGYDRGPERYDRGGYGPRDFDRGGYDRRLDRGPERHERDGYGRGGYERRGPGREEYDRRDRHERHDDRARDRSRDRRYSDDPGKGGSKGSGKKGGAPGNKLYVANLPMDITKDAIDYVFSNYGRVQDIHIMTGRSKNGKAAAFIIYERADHARKCIMAMQQGYEIRPGDGDIIVKYADDQRDGPGGGGGRGERY